MTACAVVLNTSDDLNFGGKNLNARSGHQLDTIISYYGQATLDKWKMQHKHAGLPASHPIFIIAKQTNAHVISLREYITVRFCMTSQKGPNVDLHNAWLRSLACLFVFRNTVHLLRNLV